MINQNHVFRDGEADGWYARNREHLAQATASSESLPFEIEALCRPLEPFRGQINHVLEIGCSSGQKLECICTTLEASGAGLDPSARATEEGNQRLEGRDIQLFCGTADKLPFEAARFDLVYFGFCLYLFDRSSLLTALAEADRVLRPGGFLAITDFDPGIKSRRPYVHHPGVFSYKQDYAKFYTESGQYYLCEKKSFSHRQAHFDTDMDERVSLSILYKEPAPYPLATLD